MRTRQRATDDGKESPYTFNDFTDKHESDWELAQVDFDAPTPRRALRKGPYEVDLAQHAGGERSAWTDPKLEKRGTHPGSTRPRAPGRPRRARGQDRSIGRTASEAAAWWCRRHPDFSG